MVRFEWELQFPQPVALLSASLGIRNRAYDRPEMGFPSGSLKVMTLRLTEFLQIGLTRRDYRNLLESPHSPEELGS